MMFHPCAASKYLNSSTSSNTFQFISLLEDGLDAVDEDFAFVIDSH